MTLYDDLCDWCGHYVDPIGGDCAKALKDKRTGEAKLWCGICDEGAVAIYGRR